MPILDSLSTWPVGSVSAAVITDDGVVEEYGDTSAVFALASVTKLLVAQAVLVAVEEGAIELDQEAGPPGATVAHLLAHASGLAFATRDVEAPVGAKRIYSSSGFEVLAETVQDATGIEFGEYLREAVCEPLGMPSTRLLGPAGHGARSSVDDLARFARDMLRPTVLSDELADSARSVWFAGLDGFVPGYGRHRPNDWGLGCEIRSHKAPHWTGRGNSPETFGHFGQSGTFVWVDPALGAGCVVLTDREFGTWAKPLWSDFNDIVVRSLTKN
ncbi:serine hydrolase domain-containing protein [Gordonia sp. (in: high G+C Gram-positive bacteria)]|uniref:serine hydrolase domain-containing protein n=1 Tax=Gordonia sp. (in: high G+C Gram-positive bacteria) TaxID=84139 RepID=UPI001DCA747A|nr:serine hydrolase domain-containing protein [Gordonia sp. (in: high G+C Gram-positive bacteria)]MCB1295687.1 beta-lactamase family protein [Gordonia sp. (in: high G+C Gram-positive bacteria)]HMS75106.1 serine hydrolase domain-containing protein [Gordonia sp. (in: high G+C Gram-positive bacteria)]HQV20166.1 serine hydrolase domain-containing protein [Gordonia sp. (in: high G+C Gram-positive bacteria)]